MGLCDSGIHLPRRIRERRWQRRYSRRRRIITEQLPQAADAATLVRGQASVASLHEHVCPGSATAGPRCDRPVNGALSSGGGRQRRPDGRRERRTRSKPGVYMKVLGVILQIITSQSIVAIQNEGLNKNNREYFVNNRIAIQSRELLQTFQLVIRSSAVAHWSTASLRASLPLVNLLPPASLTLHQTQIA